MPVPKIIPAFSGGDASGILQLGDALNRSATGKVVLGLRASGRTQVKNESLHRQQQACRTDIHNAGGKVVAIVGSSKSQNGKLSSGRPDLLEAIAHAKRHNAIVCFWDMTRLFRPAAYDPLKNPNAIWTSQDFAELREFVGPGVVLAVIVPPSETIKKLRSEATKRGMEQARAQGRRLGRPSAIHDERMAQNIAADWHDGVSFGKIAERYGLSKSAVQRYIAAIESLYYGRCRG